MGNKLVQSSIACYFSCILNNRQNKISALRLKPHFVVLSQLGAPIFRITCAFNVTLTKHPKQIKNVSDADLHMNTHKHAESPLFVDANRLTYTFISAFEETRAICPTRTSRVAEFSAHAFYDSQLSRVCRG